MWVIKSIGLGLLAVLAALSLSVVALILTVIVLSARYSAQGDGIGWDPVSLVRQQPLVPILVSVVLSLLFALGFGYGYRRFYLRRNNTFV